MQASLLLSFSKNQSRKRWELHSKYSSYSAGHCGSTPGSLPELASSQRMPPPTRSTVVMMRRSAAVPLRKHIFREILHALRTVGGRSLSTPSCILHPSHLREWRRDHVDFFEAPACSPYWHVLHWTNGQSRTIASACCPNRLQPLSRLRLRHLHD